MRILGTVYLYYQPGGDFASGDFIPAQYVPTSTVKDKLKFISGASEDVAKQQSEMIISAWFQQNNNVELADRDKYEIVSKVANCEKWPNGNTKRIGILFYFQKKKNETETKAVSTPLG